MMAKKLSRKTQAEIADKFEAALDYVVTLDRFPFHIKREAAEKAAQLVAEYLDNA
jgi:acyl dehydratase